MTPTPEQIEKIAAIPTVDDLLREFERFNFRHVNDTIYPMGPLTELYCIAVVDLIKKAHAMQSLMEVQAAKVQCLVEALEKIEGAFDNGKERRHLKDVFSGKCEDVCQPCAQKRAREALTKWRSP